LILLAIVCAVCIFATDMLNSAFEENPPREKAVLDRRINSANDPCLIMTNRILDNLIKSDISNDIKEFSFLCKYIKYNIRTDIKGVLYYNSNQEMFYDFDMCACLYFNYQCEIKEGDLTDEECYERALGYLKEAFIRTPVEAVSYITDHSDKKAVSFLIKTDIFPQIPVAVTIRRDHGTLIYFNATEAAEE